MIIQTLLWLLTLLFSTATSAEQVKVYPSHPYAISFYGEINHQDPFSFPLSDKLGALVESNTAEESEHSEEENESKEFSAFDKVNSNIDFLSTRGFAFSLIERSRRSISALQPALYILHCTWKSEIE